MEQHIVIFVITRKADQSKDTCDMKEVPECKLQYMAEAIFRNFTQNSDSRKALAKRLLKGVDIDEHPEKKMLQRIDKLNKLIENETTKLDRLMDNYLDENIDINMYDMFQKKLSSRIEKYKIEILELEKKCTLIEPLEVRIENTKKSIRKLLDISYNGVDEKIIEEFVEKVIVHKEYFEWKLNFMNETIKLEVNGKSKKDGFMLEHK